MAGSALTSPHLAEPGNGGGAVVTSYYRFQTGYIAFAILQPAPAQFATHSVSTSPHILLPASRRRLNALASTSPIPAIKRRSVLRSFPSVLLLVIMPQTSLTIAISQRAARLLISDKAATAELACGWFATAGEMLKVDELPCAGITPSLTLPEPGLYQMVAAMTATNNAAPAPADTTFIGTFKSKLFYSALFNPQRY